MKDLLLTIAEFLEEEADNRAAAGSEMSDYEREPRELAERLRVALSRRPSREEAARTLYEAARKYILSIPREGVRPLTWDELGEVQGGRDRYYAEVDALLALFGGKA